MTLQDRIKQLIDNDSKNDKNAQGMTTNKQTFIAQLCDIYKEYSAEKVTDTFISVDEEKFVNFITNLNKKELEELCLCASSDDQVELTYQYIHENFILKLNEFQFQYEYLEAEFVEFLRIIPLENSGKTYSPKLYQLLQSVCGQFESILKLFCKYYDVESGNSDNFEFINKKDIFSKLVVLDLEHQNTYIHPFIINKGQMEQEFSKLSGPKIFDNRERYSKEKKIEIVADNGKILPSWWTAYNKTKHELPKGYKNGNLMNVYMGLAGLYILHRLINPLIIETRNNCRFYEARGISNFDQMFTDTCDPEKWKDDYNNYEYGNDRRNEQEYV